MTQSELNFDGATYEAEFDAERLGAQSRRVFELMKDGKWRTMQEIGNATGDNSTASISARLRDFRKPQFGSFTVNRRRRGDPSDGLFEYQVVKQ